MKHIFKMISVITLLALAIVTTAACGNNSVQISTGNSSSAIETTAEHTDNNEQAFGQKETEASETLAQSQIDPMLIGTWKQTDEVNGNWIWIFNEDGTCSLRGLTTGFSGTGTYTIALGSYTLTVDLKGWEKPVKYTYVATKNKLDMESTYSSYHCDKQ